MAAEGSEPAEEDVGLEAGAMPVTVRAQASLLSSCWACSAAHPHVSGSDPHLAVPTESVSKQDGG